MKNFPFILKGFESWALGSAAPVCISVWREGSYLSSKQFWSCWEEYISCRSYEGCNFSDYLFIFLFFFFFFPFLAKIPVVITSSSTLMTQTAFGSVQSRSCSGLKPISKFERWKEDKQGKLMRNRISEKLSLSSKHSFLVQMGLV